MKLIHKFKSPNFGKRKKGKILFVIIHYTALKNCEEAISYLCNPDKKVSSHYLIAQNGDIYNLVKDKYRAWHAGLSYWNGFKDLNSLSIGIELDFSNYKTNNKYSINMINSLISLLKFIKKKYQIKESNILGHSDIAPFRKKDPGSKFPWYKLYKKNLAFKPNTQIKYKIRFIKNWFYKNNLKSKKQISLFILGIIGYNTVPIENNNSLFSSVISAYQSHYIKHNKTGRIDNKTLNFMINHFINFMLTKK